MENEVYLWAPVDVGQVLTRARDGSGQCDVQVSRPYMDGGFLRRVVNASPRTVLIPNHPWPVGPRTWQRDGPGDRAGPLAVHVGPHAELPGYYNFVIYGPRYGRQYACLRQSEIETLAAEIAVYLEKE